MHKFYNKNYKTTEKHKRTINENGKTSVFEWCTRQGPDRNQKSRSTRKL